MDIEDIYEASERGEPIMVSESEAKREVRLHEADWERFVNECGGARQGGEWSALAIVEWLGY